MKALLSEFGDGLLGLFYTTHVLAEGEAVGKSSNTAWAVRCVKHTLVDTWGLSLKMSSSLFVTQTRTSMYNSWIVSAISPCPRSAAL